jgi:hypothetical protein
MRDVCAFAAAGDAGGRFLAARRGPRELPGRRMRLLVRGRGSGPDNVKDSPSQDHRILHDNGLARDHGRKPARWQRPGAGPARRTAQRRPRRARRAAASLRTANDIRPAPSQGTADRKHVTGPPRKTGTPGTAGRPQPPASRHSNPQDGHHPCPAGLPRKPPTTLTSPKAKSSDSHRCRAGEVPDTRTSAPATYDHKAGIRRRARSHVRRLERLGYKVTIEPLDPQTSELITTAS